MAPKKKRGGRKKGVPNKATKAVKDALVDAFDKLGGVPWLVRWGRKNPTEFLKLWAKMLPTEVKASVDGTVRLHLVEEIVDGNPATDDPVAPGPG